MGFIVTPSVASAAPGDVGFEGLSHAGTGTPTGTKRAESVLWYNDGSWWGNLWDTASSDFHIFRFDPSTQGWVDTEVATETRTDTHHDVLWDGTTLFIASHKFVNDGIPAASGYPSTLRRYSYNASTDTYTSLGSSQINNQRTETLVIDKDTTGRLWATWQQGNRIYLNVTATDGTTWGTPFAHPNAAVSVDDTSALIAFGPGKMGLMWSRQVGDSSDGFYFSVHSDGAGNTTWSTPQGIVTGERSGDDHINLKWLDSSGGRVFAAVKTSFSSSSQPLIQLLAMSSTGTWSTHTIATVAECPNRVLVLIDEGAQTLRTFATYPKPSGTTNAGVCTSSGGAIYEKTTPISNINFTTAKTARIVDADQYVHNGSSTKQNVNNGRTGGSGTANSGVLVIADVNATSRYWHHYAGPAADTTAPTVTSVSPTAGATNVAATTNASGVFSEAVQSGTVTTSTFTLTPQGSTTPVGAAVTYDAATRTATLNPTNDLAANTQYTATIKGGTSGVKDTAGNALAADRTWTFTTAAAAPSDTTPPTVSSVSPADGATGVAASSNVTGTFSEAMDASTVTGTNVTLKNAAGTAVAATVTYNATSRVVTLDPTNDLAASTTYTASIGTGVKDSAGNALAAAKTWSFTTAAAGGGGETVTLTATEDSYVLSGSTSNFGNAAVLAVDNSPVTVSYLKFDLSAYAGRTITGATLQVRCTTSGSTGQQRVKLVADDSWAEGTITYANRPALDATVLGTLGPTTGNTDYSVGLTASALQGQLGQALSLGLDSASSDGVDLASSETATAPKLVLTFAP
jgi:hypothetical protein